MLMTMSSPHSTKATDEVDPPGIPAHDDMVVVVVVVEDNSCMASPSRRMSREGVGEVATMVRGRVGQYLCPSPLYIRKGSARSFLDPSST
jgi:hypothetical protein